MINDIWTGDGLSREYRAGRELASGRCWFGVGNESQRTLSFLVLKSALSSFLSVTSMLENTS